MPGPDATNKKVRNIVIGIVVLFVLIQIIPVDRSNPPVSQDMPAPPEVSSVLHRACYNCHSNQTEWPWYSYIAPVSWMVASDVHEAREHMNLSRWDTYPRDDKHHFVRGIWRMVDKGAMPLWYYKPLHPESHISDQEKQLLKEWSTSAQKQYAISGTSDSIGQQSAEHNDDE